MTKQEREAIRARCEAATQGPWRSVEKGNTIVSHGVATIPFDCDPSINICSGISPKTHNADFVAFARTDLPAMLDALDEMEADRDRTREWLSMASAREHELAERANNLMHDRDRVQHAFDNLMMLSIANRSCAVCKSYARAMREAPCRICDHGRDKWEFDQARFEEGGARDENNP